jgi:hypothetical protein
MEAPMTNPTPIEALDALEAFVLKHNAVDLLPAIHTLDRLRQEKNSLALLVRKDELLLCGKAVTS